MTAIILSILGLFFLLILVKVKIKIEYSHEKDNDLLEVFFYFGFIKVYTYSAPLIKVDPNSASILIKSKNTIGKSEKKKRTTITPKKVKKSIELFKNLLTNIVDFKIIMTDFMKKVMIHRLDWRTSVGIGSADDTAQLVGVIWAVKSLCISFITKHMTMKNSPQYDVNPMFNQWVSHMKFSCIVSVRIGHAIFTGIKILKQFRKKTKWMTTHSVKENM